MQLSVPKYRTQSTRLYIAILLVGNSALAQEFTPGNILTSNRGLLREYALDGQLLQTLTIPHPDIGSGQDATDLIVDASGRVHILDNESFASDYLSTYLPETQQWLHNLVNISGSNADGDLSLLGDVLYTKGETISTLDFSALPLLIPGGNVSEVSVGLDGKLYVLESLSPRNTVRVVDPETLLIVDQFDLVEADNQRGIAATVTGDLFIADFEGRIFHYSPGGSQLIDSVLADPLISLIDIDLAPDGKIVAGGRFGEVVVTDVFFSEVTSFQGGSSFNDSHVAFVPARPQALTDIAVGETLSPISGSGLTSQEMVSVNLYNFGTEPLTNFAIQYDITGPVNSNHSEVFTGVIEPLAISQFAFSASADLSIPGLYTVSVSLPLPRDEVPLNNELVTSITSQPTIQGFPYFEDFEADNGLFVTSGVKSSWEYGAPDRSFISAASSGTFAWVTDPGGAANAGEQSYLLSPVFDCSQMLLDPMLRFEHIYELGSSDQSWVEVSIDGGPFTKLGEFNDPGAVNWYNDPFDDWWDGFSGPEGVWRSARHLIPGAAGHAVAVRWYFGSSILFPEEGVGIDNVEFFEAPFGGGQPPQPGTSLLDINDSLEALGFPVSEGHPGPYFAVISSDEPFDMHIEGPPLEPIIFVTGGLDVAARAYPFGQLDLSPSTVLASGLETGGLNPFFFTNGAGTMDLSVTVPQAFFGQFMTFQAFIGGRSSQLSLTNAVEVLFLP